MRSNKEDLGISGSKTRFAFLNPTLYCFYFAIIVMFASCLFDCLHVSLCMKHRGQCLV